MASFEDEEDIDMGLADDIAFSSDGEGKEEQGSDNNKNNDLISVQTSTDDKEREKESEKLSDEKMKKPQMTKYERAKILGTRALQISMDAPVMVPLNGETDPLEIAIKELREGVLPFTIRRQFPDGSYKEWNVSDMIDPYA
ncbi:hypothetical protein HN51_037026 [Arachis hypogaea]|uniref:DNA-directed RNA polymerases II and V subunit 6B-like isoform X1 n=1 Tax=Arachis ipaensis TaxID=130454 RepID=UPI000A2B3DD3|nr:DNA-directed RNA polymerases II and V subunit 6B-like isoform X1 [Arachis ipaensis]XP_025641176.1 DNA-directed RNA polymerases II and V subunit 6B-like isoform X1 [Arachis hypogaea]QHO02505.1 DNA-directed RNA polymerases II, IV and V subunit 6A [Arachis hypogaea]